MVVRLIGVPFDGSGREAGQAAAPAALRAAGLEAAFPRRPIVSRPDLKVPAARAERAPESGLLNGAALMPMLHALELDVRASFSAGEFPLVYGADCSVLLAAVPALRAAAGEPGLLFIDGHEDATLMEQSPDGEAANMEIAVLLGLTGDRLPQPVRKSFGALKPDALAMLGPHDLAYRRDLGVGTIADRVMLRSAEEIAEDPAAVARDAVQRISSMGRDWWLHVDLDVLDKHDFSACGVPGEVPLSTGLTWEQLTDVVLTALRLRPEHRAGAAPAGRCRGLSLVIYNPDLDPDGSQARRIVRFVSEIAPHLP